MVRTGLACTVMLGRHSAWMLYNLRSERRRTLQANKNVTEELCCLVIGCCDLAARALADRPASRKAGADVGVTRWQEQVSL